MKKKKKVALLTSTREGGGRDKALTTCGKMNLKNLAQPLVSSFGSLRNILEPCCRAARTVADQRQLQRKISFLRQISSSELIPIAGYLLQTVWDGARSAGFQKCTGRINTCSLEPSLFLSTASCDSVFTYRLHSFSSCRQQNRW